MKNLKSAVVMLLGVALVGVTPTWGATVTLGPGDTIDWDTNAPASGDEIDATGGTLNFNSSMNVTNVFNLSGEVTVNIAAGATVRFVRTFRKKIETGRMVLSSSAQFGSNNNSVYAFLPADSVAFAASAPSDAKLTLKGYVSMTERPETWGLPVEYASKVYLCFYGANMTPGGTYTMIEDSSLRLTSPTNLPSDTTVQVPSSSTLVYRPTIFNPLTCAGSTIDDSNTKTYGSNDVVLAGGMLSIVTGSSFFYFGNVTGAGTVQKEDDPFGATYFRGSVAGMDSSSRICLRRGKNSKASETGNKNEVRLSSDFIGQVEFQTEVGKYYTNIVTFGFQSYDQAKPTSSASGKTNEIWTVGSIKGGNHIFLDGAAGARLQYSAMQKIRVGNLSGKLAVYATANSGANYMDDLEVDEVADNTEIYVQNGLRMTFGTIGRGVKVFFRTSQVNPTTITATNGAFAEIGFLGANVQSQPVTLKADVDLITGKGNVIVTEGNRRIGATDSTVTVDVQGGTVTFGSGASLSAVLGARPAIWLDASDTEKMVGAYNTGWADSRSGKNILAAHPAVTFNGSLTATYTNGFPLVEKWFDKRPEQTLTYGWQDRCVNYESTLYTLVYPYLVPNGLNGRAYMSFGEHGMTDLPDTVGTSRASGKENEHRERRRMPLMHDMNGSKPQGDNINACALIVVFGSQQGGGRAIVGSYYGNDRWTGSNIGSANGNTSCTAKFLRGGTSNDCDIAQALFKSGNGGNNAKTVWIDGRQVDSSATGLNGDWQIISVTNKADTFRSLGEGEYNKSAECSGGQNYAELIAFTNAITVAERQAVENYLAMKWGLSNARPVKGSVTVAAGATVKGAVANVSGAGTWELDSPETRLALDGTSFAGTLASSGTVTVADAAYLPSFAPSFSGAAEVADGNLSFTYANGAFAPALVAAEADLTFSATPTVTVTTGGTIVPGDYPLVSGKSLTGLTDCTLVHDIGHGMKAKLLRTATSLVLRVMPSGITVIFR